MSKPSLLPEPSAWHDVLCDTLSAVRGQRIVLLVNRGNRGDGVIHRGGRRLLQSLGLTWQEIHQPEAPAAIDADVLVVFGNGAFCRATHSMADLVSRYAAQVQRVIILPASFDLTCSAVKNFAATWGDNYTVFCRERRSFSALQQAAVKPRELLLAHDLAFYADLQPWAVRPHAGTVGIFRRDREAVFERRPTDLPGQDISRGPDSQAEVLLDYVARFSTVYTDRTHAAITAAMMGREVHFFRNAYFKNQAIYEHSLSHLPHVHFIGKMPFSFRQLTAALFTHYVQRNAYRLRQRWREARGSTAPASRQPSVQHP